MDICLFVLTALFIWLNYWVIKNEGMEQWTNYLPAIGYGGGCLFACWVMWLDLKFGIL